MAETIIVSDNSKLEFSTLGGWGNALCLLISIFKTLLDHKPEFAGVLALTAVIQEDLKPFAQIVRRGR